MIFKSMALNTYYGTDFNILSVFRIKLFISFDGTPKKQLLVTYNISTEISSITLILLTEILINSPLVFMIKDSLLYEGVSQPFSNILH